MVVWVWLAGKRFLLKPFLKGKAGSNPGLSDGIVVREILSGTTSICFINWNRIINYSLISNITRHRQSYNASKIPLPYHSMLLYVNF